MSALDRILDLLPPPYAVAADGMLATVIDRFALEFDAAQEDIDRVRRTHWVRQAYRFEDVRKLGALFHIDPLAWETLESYRVRLLALVEAQIDGALGPDDIRRFVETYLRGAEEALESVLIPGLGAVIDPWRPSPIHPAFQPLQLVEFPPRTRQSGALAARGGLVPVLHRWTEANQGLDDSVATFRIMGLGDDRTVAPLILNLRTGEMILFADRLRAGAQLEILHDQEAEDGRAALALLDGVDVTRKLRSASGVVLGQPSTLEAFDAVPLLPRFTRGEAEWLFLSIGLFDVRGLDHMFFALADEALREGRFDETGFDQSLFPSGPLAHVEMAWIETEPAAFDVVVPRTVVVSPAGAPEGGAPHELVADALRRSIDTLHAAGVRAGLIFAPFREEQPQTIRTPLPWIRLDREFGPAGAHDKVELGMHFGETKLGRARFE